MEEDEVGFVVLFLDDRTFHVHPLRLPFEALRPRGLRQTSLPHQTRQDHPTLANNRHPQTQHREPLSCQSSGLSIRTFPQTSGQMTKSASRPLAAEAPTKPQALGRGPEAANAMDGMDRREPVGSRHRHVQCPMSWPLFRACQCTTGPHGHPPRHTPHAPRTTHDVPSAAQMIA